MADQVDGLAEARRAEADGDWVRAYQKWDALAQARPRALSPLLGRARALLRQAKLDEAFAEYQRAAEKFPDRTEVKQALARVDERRNPRSTLKNAVQDVSDTEKRGDWTGALAQWQKAESLWGRLPVVLLGLARSLERLGRFPEARLIYQEGLDSFPNRESFVQGVTRVDHWLDQGRPQRGILEIDQEGPLYFSPPATSGTTVLFFVGYQRDFCGIPLTQLDWFFACRNISVIYAHDPRAALFLHGIPALGLNFEGLVSALAERLESYGTCRLAALGLSGGGIDALRLGAVLQADTIVAFSSGVNLTAKFMAEHGDDKARATVRRLNQNHSAAQLDQRPFLERYRCADTSIHMVYGAESAVDCSQASYIADLAGVSLVPVAGCAKHNSASHLLRSMRLFPTLDELLNLEKCVAPAQARVANFRQRVHEFKGALSADPYQYDYLLGKQAAAMIASVGTRRRPLFDLSQKEPLQISPRSATGITVVFFTGRGDNFSGLSYPILDTYFAARGVSVIYVRERRSSIFLEGLPSLGLDQDQSIARVRSHCESLQTRVLITVGLSGAGTGALVYGAELMADAMLVFSPGINMSTDFMQAHRDTRAMGAIRRMNQRLSAEQLDVRNRLVDLPDQCRVRVVYSGDSTLDEQQAQHIADLPQVELQPVANAWDHNVARDLVNRGELFSVFDSVLSPHLEE